MVLDPFLMGGSASPSYVTATAVSLITFLTASFFLPCVSVAVSQFRVSILQRSFSSFDEKEERKKENGNIAWHRSSLLQAWAAEIVS